MQESRAQGLASGSIRDLGAMAVIVLTRSRAGALAGLQISRRQTSDTQTGNQPSGEMTPDGRGVFEYVILTVLLRRQLVGRKWLSWKGGGEEGDSGTH